MTSRKTQAIDQLAIKLAQDYPFYSQHCLNIRTKAGSVLPFKLNKAQLYAHDLLEKQRRETGRVRAIIVKGRQQGFSTYIAGRFYHRVTHALGMRCFILAHEMEASDNLFGMVNRFHENMVGLFKPTTGAANAKELYFNKLDSGYKVSTAGNKATGRSQTIQLFHGSEVAFWPNDKEHAAGILQAVPNEDGTEVILESTGNGMNNLFYEMAMKAYKGEGQYQLIFVPWFMSDEYRIPGGKVELSPEDEAYKQAYDLDDEQMAWRADKIAEFGKYRFMQEYPAILQEAFQASGDESFIHRDTIMEARTRTVGAFGDVILGVDPSGEGKDRTALVWRQGPKMLGYETFQGDEMEIVGRVVAELQKGIRCAFIDAIGIGSGIAARLHEIGYRNNVIKVIGSNSPESKEKYLNKRAECWGRMRDWLAESSIPNDDEIHMDLSLLGWKYDSNGRIRLQSKEDLRREGKPSPDIADALSFTFAYNIGSFDINPKVIRNDPWK